MSALLQRFWRKSAKRPAWASGLPPRRKTGRKVQGKEGLRTATPTEKASKSPPPPNFPPFFSLSLPPPTIRFLWFVSDPESNLVGIGFLPLIDHSTRWIIWMLATLVVSSNNGYALLP